MDRVQKLGLLMQVLRGKAHKSSLKVNKLLYRRGGGVGCMFEINGKNATITDVFALLYTDPSFETEVIKL